MSKFRRNIIRMLQLQQSAISMSCTSFDAGCVASTNKIRVYNDDFQIS